MLDLMAGIENTLDDSIDVEVNGLFVTVNKIVPLCNTKIDLVTSKGPLKLKSFEEEGTTEGIPLKNVIYDLDFYVEEDVLFIRPSREYVFNYCESSMPKSKVTAALEHIDDFQMDLLFKVADALVADNKLVLTENETLNYNKLKQQWQETTSVTLDSATYQIDYAFNGDGVGYTPKGVKSLSREMSGDYLTLINYYNYQF